MAMNADNLGRRMAIYWSRIPPDEDTVNRLGDVMYDGIMKVMVDQHSNPDGTLGRQRARETARAMLTEFFNRSGETTLKRFTALAAAIILEIQAFADVLPLTVANTPADGPAHTHAPAITYSEQGRIR